jgi:hypothetical protein
MCLRRALAPAGAALDRAGLDDVRSSTSQKKIKDRTLDNVQNCDGYINIPSSETYG